MSRKMPITVQLRMKKIPEDCFRVSSNGYHTEILKKNIKVDLPGLILLISEDEKILGGEMCLQIRDTNDQLTANMLLGVCKELYMYFKASLDFEEIIEVEEQIFVSYWDSLSKKGLCTDINQLAGFLLTLYRKIDL